MTGIRSLRLWSFLDGRGVLGVGQGAVDAPSLSGYSSHSNSLFFFCVSSFPLHTSVRSADVRWRVSKIKIEVASENLPLPYLLMQTFQLNQFFFYSLLALTLQAWMKAVVFIASKMFLPNCSLIRSEELIHKQPPYFPISAALICWKVTFKVFFCGGGWGKKKYLKLQGWFFSEMNYALFQVSENHGWNIGI